MLPPMVRLGLNRPFGTPIGPLILVATISGVVRFSESKKRRGARTSRIFLKVAPRKILPCQWTILQLLVAGAGGFEPPYGGIKIHCLTTWRRPKAEAEGGEPCRETRSGHAGL